MPDGYVLSDDDLKLLKQFALSLRQKVVTPLQRPPGGQTGAFIDQEEYPSPELYIAKTPTGGIPANATLGSIGENDVPGSALCQILRLRATVPGERSALRVAFEKRLFNLSTTAIDGEKWVFAVKDKFGDWYALPVPDTSEPEPPTPGTGSGSGSGSGSGTGTATVDCCSCFDDPYSEPDGLDPEVLIDQTEADVWGQFFLVYAKIRIVCDPDTFRARNQLYDYRYELRCFAPCPGTGTDYPPIGTGTNVTGIALGCCTSGIGAVITATPSGGETPFDLTFNTTTDTWVGNSGIVLSCGEMLYLQYTRECGLFYSCDGVTYVPATKAIGSPDPVCTTDGSGNTIAFTDTDWLLNMDDPNAGCAVGGCVSLTVNLAAVL